MGWHRCPVCGRWIGNHDTAQMNDCMKVYAEQKMVKLGSRPTMGHNQTGSQSGQQEVVAMATAAEKRAELEAKLTKLNPEALAAQIESRKAKLEAEMAKLEAHKDVEGKVALFDVYGDGSFKVRVVVNSYSRKVYGKELFDVSPMDGEGNTTASMNKLEIEGEAPAATDINPEATGSPTEAESGNGKGKRGKKHNG